VERQRSERTIRLGLLCWRSESCGVEIADGKSMPRIAGAHTRPKLGFNISDPSRRAASLKALAFGSPWFRLYVEQSWGLALRSSDIILEWRS
jgi:hypothetical protein